MRVNLYFSLFIFSFFFGCNKKTATLIEPLNEVDITIVKIAEDRSGLGPCEPSIAINPTDPSQLIVGSILDRIHLSKDGGKTWASSKLTSPFGVYGDPVVGIDHHSNYFYAHLSNPDNSPYQGVAFLDRIVVQHSSDEGATWSGGTFPANDMTKDQDKHWLHFDNKSDDMLMTWTEFDKYGSDAIEDRSRILFSKSSDQAKTWSDPISISNREGNCLDDDNTTEGAIPVSDVNGNYHVVWAYNDKLYMNSSFDSGKTWLENDRMISEQVGGWTLNIPGINRCNGMPVLKIDNSSGDHAGNLYVNFSDQLNGEDDTDIWIIKSTDNGKTWSSRKRINDDLPGKQQFFSWMDVDPITGYIYVVFYDRRDYDNNRTAVYLAYSKDGGETFVNKRISKTPFTPNAMIFFGDYNNIVAYDNMVYPVWTEYSEGKLSVWTAIISMK